MIVKETRIVFSLEDVQRVIIRCIHCGGEVSSMGVRVSLNTTTGLTKALDAESCPTCTRSWKADTTTASEIRQAEQQLLNALDRLTSSRFKEAVNRNEVHRAFFLEISGDTL